MALAAGRRGRCSWIAAAAAVLLGSQPVVASAAVLEARVASSHDDAEEFATGKVYLDSSDLELVEDDTTQIVGMRWAGLALPRGATITRAWIQFSCKVSGTGATDLEIQAQAADDAAPFTTTARDISARPRTAVDVDWIPAAWAVGDSGLAQQTPDLEELIEEVVNRPGWAPGHALVIVIRGTGQRTAWAWDGRPDAAPLLHIEYDGESPPPPPSGPIALYAGYYDTHHPDNTRPKPNPWKGSPGVVFVGNSDPDGGWDSSCLRLDNLTPVELSNVVVTVDIGVEHYALWGTRAIPAGGKLILAQTGFENFDGSDTNEAGCPSCSPSDCLTKVSSTIPVITVRIGSASTRYFDRDQVLNTRGVDAAGCPYTGGRSDESQNWLLVPGGDPNAAGVGDPPPDSTSLPSPIVVELAAPTPNPARSSVMFRFRMPVAGDVQLGMYDVAGRLVRSCLDGWYEAGTYLKGLDLDGVQPGVYFGVLRVRGGVVRRSFTVRR